MATEQPEQPDQWWTELLPEEAATPPDALVLVGTRVRYVQRDTGVLLALDLVGVDTASHDRWVRAGFPGDGQPGALREADTVTRTWLMAPGAAPLVAQQLMRTAMMLHMGAVIIVAEPGSPPPDIVIGEDPEPDGDG